MRKLPIQLKNRQYHVLYFLLPKAYLFLLVSNLFLIVLRYFKLKIKVFYVNCHLKAQLLRLLLFRIMFYYPPPKWILSI